MAHDNTSVQRVQDATKSCYAVQLLSDCIMHIVRRKILDHSINL